MMWIRQLFCWHSFDFLRKVEVFETAESKYPIKAYHTYICKKCLKIHKVRI